MAIYDSEAYPNQRDLPDPPDSPWRTRLQSHRDKNTAIPRFKRYATYASFLALALPLFLLFHHIHGSSSDLAASETIFVPPPVQNVDVPNLTALPALETSQELPPVHDNHGLPSQTFVEQSHPVTFALIMFSADSASEGALLIKSILMYMSTPVHFHIICDQPAQEYLEGRLALVTRPRHGVVFRFYQMTHEKMVARIEREGSITTDHSAGIPGLMKLFIHEILPDTVKKAIFLDTDAFFISDPLLLWNQFDLFGPEAAISMPTHDDQSAPEWHDANKICSCVMLLDLDKLRTLRLMDSSAYRNGPDAKSKPALSPPAFRAMFGIPKPEVNDGHYEGVKLGDQGYWWAIVYHRPEILQHLRFDYEVSSCLMDMYGTGLGDDGADETQAKVTQVHVVNTKQHDDTILPKVLHFNCLDGTPRFFEWEGWSDPNDSLTQRWGAAVSYHVGFKWLWLNQGQKDVSPLTVETVQDLLFADEKYAFKVGMSHHRRPPS